MKKLTLILGFLTTGLLATKASAITTVYDNGPINGTYTAFAISFVFDVSDSFTLSSPATINEAQVGLWLNGGDTPTSLDWSIGTTAEASDIDSGTATLSNTFQFTNSFRFNIYESTFSLNESLAAGTYWLTLRNASTPADQPVGWDDNGGPSSAFQGGVGGDGDLSTVNPLDSGSESFQLFSDATAGVPEPVTAMLLGLASAGLIGYGVKRRKA